MDYNGYDAFTVVLVKSFKKKLFSFLQSSKCMLQGFLKKKPKPT